MKRYGNLYPQITDFANLVLAAHQAQKGKRFREKILKFNYNLEAKLAKIKSELESKTYHPGRYKTFEICEPKPRLISAAPYRDRVVHHALCNIIVPIFERTFIADSYANRLGFGTHKALRRFTSFARSSRYILQCDIKKYFLQKMFATHLRHIQNIRRDKSRLYNRIQYCLDKTNRLTFKTCRDVAVQRLYMPKITLKFSLNS
ncbi:RNA-directed DNA polymerase [Fischerella sp. NIES-4106]|nr:RNA-directed DNA polymerase [Fischerella sp. NIES-4106]